MTGHALVSIDTHADALFDARTLVAKAERAAAIPAPAKAPKRETTERQLTLVAGVIHADLVPAPTVQARRLLNAYGTVRAAAEAAAIPRSTFYRVAYGAKVVRRDIAAAITTAHNALPDASQRFLEDLTDLLDAGESLTRIASRLGVNAESITRRLQEDRLDRPDLLARLSTAERTATPTATGLSAPDLDAPACQGTDLDQWFPENAGGEDEVFAICGGCPVRAACLQGALDRREPWGVWGGVRFVNGEPSKRTLR